LEFAAVGLRYRPGLPFAVRNLSFVIASGERVGIVGRTGAGKSTLISLCFRIAEPTEGKILLDGFDVSELGLEVLRSRLAVLPQTPLILSASVKENLDPFGEYSKYDIGAALARVGLAVALEDDASLLSVGEKQLLALARLVIRPRSQLRLLIFDEPTANIDEKTDRRVQSSIREAFAGCTTLTIAHRVNTVLDSDRILVLDQGEIAEFDTAAKLLSRQGIFASFMRASTMGDHVLAAADESQPAAAASAAAH